MNALIVRHGQATQKLVFQLQDDTKTMMLVRKNNYVGLQQKNPTKELMMFWPRECPDSQVGMDNPPKNWFFNSWMTPKIYDASQEE